MSIVYAQKNLTDDTTDAFDSLVTILLAGLDTVAVQLAGTFAGTVEFEVTTDGDTWASLSMTPSAGGAAVTSATGTGIWAADGCAGYYAARARCSTYTSGTIIASIGAGANSVAAVTSAADGQVLFMDGTAPSGDSGLTWNTTTNALEINQQARVTGVVDDANNSEPALVVHPASGTQVGLLVASAFTDGSTWTGLWIDATQVSGAVAILSQINGSSSTTSMLIRAGTGGLQLTSTGVVFIGGADGNEMASDVILDDGIAIKTDTTPAHTATIKAYDVDGAAYATFVTLTNGNTPQATISQPAGGKLVFIPPTDDPHVVGALWNNSGTLAISAG